VVVRQERIYTRQPRPLALRMGLEAPGFMRDRHEDNRGDQDR
jgi:hypothetical protein